MEIKLLAWDANKKGTLGFLLHRCGKKFIRYVIDKLANSIMKDVIIYKKANGWYNPEIKILYDDLTEVISKCRYGEHEVENNEGNYRCFSDMRDVLCTVLDEDSYYLLRFFYFIDLTIEHRNRYALAHHKSMAYWDWESIAEVLRAKRAEFEKLNPDRAPTNEEYNQLYDEARRVVKDGRKTCGNDS